MNKTILPVAASILLSESCNLNCSYCFEKSKKSISMTKETAKKILDYMFQNASINIKNGRSGEAAEVNLTMFGGEPMLNFEVLKYFFETGVEYQKKYNIPFSTGIITNGTIMTEEMSDYLRSYNEKYGNFSIQISVDGIKENHDYYRVYHDGRGSFDTIEKNLPLFKNIFGGENYQDTELRGRLHLHGSLNKKTLRSIYESWKFFNEKWNVPVIWYMPIHDEIWDDEDVRVYKDELLKIANDILNKCISTGNSRYIEDYAPLNKCMREPYSGFPKPCGAGHSYVTFTADGTIYSCHQFYFIDQSLFIGNVDDGIDENRRKLFYDYDAQDMNCQKLGCKNTTCYRCIAENYDNTGSIINCKIDKRCEMSTIEKNIIDEMRNILKEKNIIRGK